MSLAVREVSVAKGYDPRDFALVASGGAGPLHVCAIARELYIPTVIVPLFPVAFLGARHAARRRAPRLHPHGLFRPRQRRFRQARDGARRDGDGGQGEPAPRQERRSTRSSSTPLCRPGVHAVGAGRRSTQLKRGDRKAIRTAFDELYEHRYAHHSPDEPVEMVNIRLGAIGKRPKLKFPRLGSGRRRAARGRARRSISPSPAKPLHCQGLSARGARRGRARSPARR